VFADHGFNIAAVFDVDRDKIGQPIGKTVVSHYAALRETIREKDIVVGVLAVPASAAESVADDLVAAGVKIILDYSQALLRVPPDATVRTINPAAELVSTLSRLGP
jgi:redox-sensing transcriptional repressor